MDWAIRRELAHAHRTPREHTVFAYVFEGCGVFGHDREVGDRHVVSFDKGDVVTVSAKSEPVRFLLVSGATR